MATFNQDFKEFFESLNAHQVEFLVIGGTAYNYYAPPRATKDIDIWVRPTQANLTRLVQAISAFGFPIAEIDIDELATTTKVLMLGRAPYRIDVLTRPDGLRWEEATERPTTASYDGAPIRILSIGDLIASKRAAGRPRDLADVAMLEQIRAKIGT